MKTIIAILVAVIFMFGAVYFSGTYVTKNQAYADSDDYIQRQILQELEEVNENLKRIQELEARIIDRIDIRR